MRRVLPRPSGAVVYELTESGRELDPIVLGLARWGNRWLGEPQEGDSVSPASLVLGLRANFRPVGADGRARDVRAAPGRDGRQRRRLRAGALAVAEGPADAPDLTIHADFSLRTVLTGGTSDTIRLEGDEALFAQFVEAFRIDPVTRGV